MQNSENIRIERDRSAISWRTNWNPSAEMASFYLLIATLAWAPFPLGSNRPWSWTLLAFLVLACWGLWLVAVWRNPAFVAGALRRVAGPLILASGALLWGLVQVCSWVPPGWDHPVWAIAADGLNQPVSGMISLNGWRTVTELMKLLTYLMAGWLAYCLCQRPERAKRLLDALIAIGTFYAGYALVMAMLGLGQVQLLYSTPPEGSPVAAPFVTHAGFACLVGLALIAACARFFLLGRENIVTVRGLRPLFLTTLKFVFGRGTPLLLSVALLFSMLIASAARAGFLSALAGAIALLLFAAVLGSRKSVSRWNIAAIAIAVFAAFALFQVNGASLQARLSDLTNGGALIDLRNVLWGAAMHMTGDAPKSGLGLGSFEHAYPLYADGVYPFNMDKAHNDYLELAAGWGLPAALAWWGALLWLAVLCGRGALVRRRHQIYPLVAVAAMALIGVYSVFDFTLQLPAISLTFATILGCGVAQSFSSRG